MTFQDWNQPDDSFECLVLLPFREMPLVRVKISQEIMRRIFVLPGSFQFSATLH